MTTITRDKKDERIIELCQAVVQLRTAAKPALMAQAFARWDGNASSKPNAGLLTQQYSEQYDLDTQIDLPELYGEGKK